MAYTFVDYVEYEGCKAIVLNKYASQPKNPDDADTLYDLYVFADVPYHAKGVRHLDLHGEVLKPT